jgi:hypothetical protein
MQTMKSRFQKLVIGLTFLVTTGFDNRDTWTLLSDRTWRSDFFAGSEIIFYQTANGLRKAILQIHGSGVPLAGATIFDVETDDEGALLKDGLDLMERDKEVLKSIRLNLTSDTVFMLDNKTFKKKFDYLTALNWQSKIGQADRLDIERLKSISIDKKSIYKTDCFKK